MIKGTEKFQESHGDVNQVAVILYESKVDISYLHTIHSNENNNMNFTNKNICLLINVYL